MSASTVLRKTTPNGEQRQAAIVTFIREFVAEHHYSPTIREIAKAVKLVSPSSVAYQLGQLAGAGVLTFEQDKPRSIVLLDTVPAGEICWRCHGSGRTS